MTTAAIHIFSNFYPCPLNNGSFASYWCCGHRASDGCCNGPLFTQAFGRVIATNAISSSSTLSSPSSTAVKTVDPSTSPPTYSSLHITESSSFTVSAALSTCSVPAPVTTPVDPSPCPVQSSDKSVVVGTAVGIPLAVHFLFGSAFLFLRERRRRIHAEKMCDDAHAAAQEKEKEMEREIMMAKSYRLRNQDFPQEMEHVPRGPKEIDSQELYEANGGP